MRCPKCHYLSFEPEPRCRNCGYDPALSEPVAATSPESHEELDTLETPAGLEEFRREQPEVSERPRRRSSVPAAAARAAARVATLEQPVPQAPAVVPAPAPAPVPVPVSVPAVAATAATVVASAVTLDRPALTPVPPPTSDLPLFVRASATAVLPVDEPLVELAPVQRPPLVVQRRPSIAKASPAEPRVLTTFDRDFAQDLRRLEAVERRPSAPHAEPVAVHQASERGVERVGIGRRLQAALIDLSFLGTVAAAVLWLTARWAGLTMARVFELPLLPIAAYLLIVAGAYILMFTVAGGQTVGKMLTGLRVVTADGESDRASDVSWRQAAIRALVTIPSVLLLGAGFLTLFGAGGRAIHDRLSETRVIRA